ncbi:MAG: lipase [Leptolyngbyaceae cyanobacterium SM2_3_12]|nr:lipase [Leptolyngbyaceae cyanobacterium SM2_3_12]
MTLPTVILPGYLAGAAPYQGMVRQLNDRGIPTTTVPLTRRDWWPTLGGQSMGPILQKLDQTVQAVRQSTGAEQVNLVGHSAGGWIARIYLGEKPYAVHAPDLARRNVWAAHAQVATLITLGTPHTSQERWTRRNLDFVNNTYPGAFYPGITYLCVAGQAIYGQRWRQWFTFNSYTITCGTGACWGDGITPISAAHLAGANNLVFEGVHHSPQPGVTWYGTQEVVERWAEYLK